MNYLKCSECGKIAPYHLQSDEWKEKYKKLKELEIELGIYEKLSKVWETGYFALESNYAFTFCWGGGKNTYYLVTDKESEDKI